MRNLFFFVAFCFIQCSTQNPLELNYKQLEGTELNIQSAAEANAFTVLVFLSPECPLCQNYAPTINQIESEFESEGVSFIGIVSGNFYPREQILTYRLKYGIEFPIILDPEIGLAEKLNAEITPEIVVLDSKTQIVYQGAIDNWAISLGQKRLKANSHYLVDALSNGLMNERIDPSKTKAVGCFIE